MCARLFMKAQDFAPLDNSHQNQELLYRPPFQGEAIPPQIRYMRDPFNCNISLAPTEPPITLVNQKK